MTPSDIGWITASLVVSILTVILIKFRRPVESRRTQRYHRIGMYAYIMLAVTWMGVAIWSGRLRPSAIGVITSTALAPIAALLMMKLRKPTLSGQEQRYPRTARYIYSLIAILLWLIGIIAINRGGSELWAGIVFVFGGLGSLVGVYFTDRYRLTAATDSIIIHHPFRGDFHITRANSTMTPCGVVRGQEITKFTLDDGRTIKVYSPLFDIRPYTRGRTRFP